MLYVSYAFGNGKTNQRKLTPQHHQYPKVQADLQIPTFDP